LLKAFGEVHPEADAREIGNALVDRDDDIKAIPTGRWGNGGLSLGERERHPPALGISVQVDRLKSATLSYPPPRGEAVEAEGDPPVSRLDKLGRDVGDEVVFCRGAPEGELRSGEREISGCELGAAIGAEPE
jgi:hypothetical protein